MSRAFQASLLAAAAFDAPVPANGYRWWYLDAASDDGRHGLVIIAFVGSVFSPYYYRARQRGRGNPEEHCAVNVALYGSARRWAMTERPAAAVSRRPAEFVVGPSRLEFSEGVLRIAIRERSMPFARPVRGEVLVEPEFVNDEGFFLDRAARHRWQPLAPRARVSVAFDRPALAWQGNGYLDTNHGDEPLEARFRGWDWSRVAAPDGTELNYNVVDRDGRERPIALRFDPEGRLERRPPAARRALGPSGWRIVRSTRDAGSARIAESLEDTPFYARSRLELGGGEREAVHEMLDLERFRQPWVRLLLPFRMPRAGVMSAGPQSASSSSSRFSRSSFSERDTR